MPNEYTQNIYDGKEVSFSHFVIQCARNSGVFLGVLEENEPIPEKFEPSNEQLVKLRDAMDRLSTIEAWDDETSSIMAVDEFERGVEEARLHNDRVKQLKRRYEAMFSKASAWEPPSQGHRSLKDFMLSKLGKSIDADYSLMAIPDKPLSGAAFKEKQIELMRQEILFHATEYKKEVESAANRSEWVLQLNESL